MKLHFYSKQKPQIKWSVTADSYFLAIKLIKELGFKNKIITKA